MNSAKSIPSTHSLVSTRLVLVAVTTAGEPLSAPLGNDYASGAGGGPPRRDRP